MKKQAKLIAGILLTILIMGLGWWKRESLQAFVLGVFKPDMQIYVSDSGKFSAKLPGGWELETSTPEGMFVTRVVASPKTGGYQAGNIGQMSITITATSSADQPLSTPTEFEIWQNKPDQEVKGTGLFKVKNEEVAGSKAVRLAEADMVEESVDQSFWSVTTWFRKEDKNYYINMMGNGKLTTVENDFFDKVLNGFKLN
jgi:hypothetical protein